MLQRRWWVKAGVWFAHVSKQMIYEVYGKYTEGLEKDRKVIQRYFGDDFNPAA